MPSTALRVVRLTFTVPLMAMLVAALTVPAQARSTAVVTTATCRDGGGTSWRTKVTWAPVYYSSRTQQYHRRARAAAWSTTASVAATDHTVRSYSGRRLVQTLRGRVQHDYRKGGSWASRNPADPVSAPGTSRIEISVGVDGDGKKGCSTTHREPGGRTAAARHLGATRSGLPWHSGAWPGGRFSEADIEAFGAWRGRPTDVVTTYAETSSFAAMKDDTWPIETWRGFEGKLSYGLPLLPADGAGSLATIAAGEQDAVWRGIASNLQRLGRGDSIVRVGYESNLPDFRHQVTTTNVPTYKAAYRRIVKIMRAEAPQLIFEFGVNCGSALQGSSDRLAPLSEVYPGDDVVDLVGCDTYDWWTTHAAGPETWADVLRPRSGPGVQDVVDFARARDRGASFGEWGLARRQGGNNGGGDNPYYIEAMHRFFRANADVVAFECYFDEPDPYIANSLFTKGQNPKASARYAQLWGRP